MADFGMIIVIFLRVHSKWLIVRTAQLSFELGSQKTVYWQSHTLLLLVLCFYQGWRKMEAFTAVLFSHDRYHKRVSLKANLTEAPTEQNHLEAVIKRKCICICTTCHRSIIPQRQISFVSAVLSTDSSHFLFSR